MANLYYEIINSKDVFVIAEAGVNHNGDINTAKKLVDVAVNARVDAVKFQIFKSEETASRYAKLAAYQDIGSKKAFTQLEMLKELELSFDDFRELKHYCDEKKIVFLATPDDIYSLNFLLEIKVPLIKIGSTEITNLDFLKEISRKGIPVILSTGMASLAEVEKALISLNLLNEIIVLHCVSSYPTSPDEVNLNAMITLKEKFGIPVGFSDHTIGFEAAIAATALGAKVIEKHFTLDKNDVGPDHKVSLDPSELKKFVEYIRNAQKLLGSGIKEASKSEKIIMKDIRRSIVAAHDLKKGSILCESCFKYKRPGDGISPEFAGSLEGKVLKRNLKEDEAIRWEDI